MQSYHAFHIVFLLGVDSREVNGELVETSQSAVVGEVLVVDVANGHTLEEHVCALDVGVDLVNGLDFWLNGIACSGCAEVFNVGELGGAVVYGFFTLKSGRNHITVDKCASCAEDEHSTSLVFNVEIFCVLISHGNRVGKLNLSACFGSTEFGNVVNLGSSNLGVLNFQVLDFPSAGTCGCACVAETELNIFALVGRKVDRNINKVPICASHIGWNSDLCPIASLTFSYPKCGFIG